MPRTGSRKDSLKADDARNRRRRSYTTSDGQIDHIRTNWHQMGQVPPRFVPAVPRRVDSAHGHRDLVDEGLYQQRADFGKVPRYLQLEKRRERRSSSLGGKEAAATNEWKWWIDHTEEKKKRRKKSHGGHGSSKKHNKHSGKKQKKKKKKKKRTDGKANGKDGGGVRGDDKDRIIEYLEGCLVKLDKKYQQLLPTVNTDPDTIYQMERVVQLIAEVRRAILFLRSQEVVHEEDFDYRTLYDDVGVVLATPSSTLIQSNSVTI